MTFGDLQPRMLCTVCDHLEQPCGRLHPGRTAAGYRPGSS
jgi:hypothetical protein